MRLPYLRLGCAATYAAIKDLRAERDDLAISALLWLVLDPLPRMVLELLEFESMPVDLISRGLPEVGTRKTGPIKNKKYKLKGVIKHG